MRKFGLRCTFLSVFIVTSTSQLTPAQDGAALYRQRCAACHEGGASDRAPDRVALQYIPTSSIVRTLETGVMRDMAGSLTPAQRDAIAAFLTAGAPRAKSSAEPHPPIGLCSASSKSFSVEPGAPQWNSWSPDLTNHRFQPAAMAGVSASDVSRLKLKWAFGFEGDSLAFSQPTIVGGSVFVGSQQGKVFSLDAGTGCLRWSFQAEIGVRTAVAIGPLSDKQPANYGAFFGDQRGAVYAMDAATGRLLWKVQADSHPQARITGSPRLWRGRLYVVTRVVDPSKGGGLFALRLATGEKVWQTLPSQSVCKDRPNCSPAQSSAVTAIPGFVFSGAMDGHLRAYSTTDGRVVWDFDAVRDFSTVNGVPARGGAFDGPGPVIVGGILYVNSGYGRFGEIPGNVLLAFSVDGK